MNQDNPRAARADELKWLNDGFDPIAMEALDAEYFRRALKPSGMPSHWVFAETPRDLDVSQVPRPQAA